MKVVILCGGKGTRLNEGTMFPSKPMAEIGGRPILWHLMMNYASQGYQDFILLLGYRGELIKEYFLTFPERTTNFSLEFINAKPKITYLTEHSLLSWRITFIETGLETQTGARLARVRQLLGDGDFFLTYADGLSDIDLKALYQTHQKLKRVMTVTGVRQESPYGLLETDAGRVISFQEKPMLNKVINGGFFVCSPGIFDYLSEDESCTLEKEPLRRLVSDDQLAIYEHHGFWRSMDTLKQLLELNELWRTNPPWRIWS